jgi:Tfp pilus assembly protein PilN
VRAVNLLPRDHSQKGGNLPGAPVLAGVCAGVLVAAVIGADFMMQSGKVTKEQRALDALQAKVDALPAAPSGPSAGQTQLAGEHSARVAALSAAMATRVAWDRVFRELSLILPGDVWLTNLTAHAPVSPTAAPGTAAPAAGSPATQFSIQGRTYSHDGVARLLSRLQIVPDLQNVTLVSSTMSDPDKGPPVVDFSIVADLRTAAGGPTS